MTARWRKLLGKATDVLITIPVGTPIWPSKEHEPLIFAISFPLSTRRLTPRLAGSLAASRLFLASPRGDYALLLRKYTFRIDVPTGGVNQIGSPTGGVNRSDSQIGSQTGGVNPILSGRLPLPVAVAPQIDAPPSGVNPILPGRSPV
jgi:hypothetical protein